MAVAWYAVHPLCVEPVAWMSCQSYLSGALFIVITIPFPIKRVEARSLSPADWSRGMLVSYGFDLLFKAQAIALPAILIVLDIYLVMRVTCDPSRWFGRSYKAVLLNRLPFIGLAFIFAVVAYRAKASTFYGARSQLSAL